MVRCSTFHSRSVPMPGHDGEWKKAGRDSSTAQADSFAGAKEEEKRRLAPLGMTVLCLMVMCFAVMSAGGAPFGRWNAKDRCTMKGIGE
jgi:hypothetical protein